MRTDAEVAPKNKSVCKKKKMNSLEMALEANERGIKRRNRREGREEKVIMVGCITT